jgi:hypothetical protein
MPMVPISPSTRRIRSGFTHLVLCTRAATAEMTHGAAAGLAGKTVRARREAWGASSHIRAICPSRQIAGRPSSLY